MSDGFFHWYRAVPPQAAGVAERVVAALEEYGVALPHPSTGVITAITNGPDSWGEQVPVGRSDLLASLALVDVREVNFQLWLNAETDVFTRFRDLGRGTIVVEFGLDGMTPQERETAIHAVSHAVEVDREETIGLVLDRRGTTEEEDWDALVTGGATTPMHDWPDLLGVRPEVAARHPQLSGMKGRMEPPLVLFTHAALRA